MATPPEQWSNHEKNYLLAEIIKAANPIPNVLFNVIRNHNIEPRWDDIPLPSGRSLNSSRFAFDEIRRTLSTQPIGAAITPHTPTPLSAPVNLKRPLKYEGPVSAGRAIRPKPSMLGAVYSHPSPSEPPAKRKRGRPTKAEAQAKADAAAAAGGSDASMASVAVQLPRQTAPTPTPLPPLVTATTTTALQEAKPALPPTTRMPIAAMLTPTTREPKSASHSSSSSGKRRRARSTRLEVESTPITRTGAGYESPYTGYRTETEQSPARTAVHRQPDDPPPPSHSGPSEEPAAETAPPPPPR